MNYIAHTSAGHLQLMSKRQPISELIEQDEIDVEKKEKLMQMLRIRQFSSEIMSLPENSSYTTYVELDRDYVTWAVFATNEFSLKPETWCFWVVGCVPYRGYFDLKKAEKFAEQLKGNGLEVYVAPIPAYSTLGWFSDPLLSSMVSRGEVAAAENIFHELAHQQLYIKDDTSFNEAFATAVGYLGVSAWLRAESKLETLQRYNERSREKKELYKLVDNLRAQLKSIYESSLTHEEKRIAKKAAYNSYRITMTAKLNSYGKYTLYEKWLIHDINNARLNALSTYQELVPEFIKLFERCDKNYQRFYRAVENMKNLSNDERVNELQYYMCELEIVN